MTGEGSNNPRPDAIRSILERADYEQKGFDLLKKIFSQAANESLLDVKDLEHGPDAETALLLISEALQFPTTMKEDSLVETLRQKINEAPESEPEEPPDESLDYFVSIYCDVFAPRFPFLQTFSDDRGSEYIKVFDPIKKLIDLEYRTQEEHREDVRVAQEAAAAELAASPEARRQAEIMEGVKEIKNRLYRNITARLGMAAKKHNVDVVISVLHLATAFDKAPDHSKEAVEKHVAGEDADPATLRDDLEKSLAAWMSTGGQAYIAVLQKDGLLQPHTAASLTRSVDEELAKVKGLARHLIARLQI